VTRADESTGCVHDDRAYGYVGVLGREGGLREGRAHSLEIFGRAHPDETLPTSERGVSTE
jgi:hypothetical protein